MPSAVVTGASSGIGRAIARELARRGYDLILVARSVDQLDRLGREWTEQYRVVVRCEAVDLADREAVTGLLARLGTPDVLVNNAGLGDYRPFHEATWDRLDAVLRVNVSALTRLTHHVLPAMRARGSGRVLNLASVAAYVPGPWMAVYFATKAYVLHLGEALAAECAGSGVTVTTLCPGATATEFHKQAGFAEDHRFFRAPFAVQPGYIARAGVKGMLAGRRVVQPRLVDRLTVIGLRLIPRRLAVAFAHRALRR